MPSRGEMELRRNLERDCIAGFRPRAGEHCWRIEHAHRFACLSDGAAYSHCLHHVLQRARHSVFLVGWDFDSRVRLVRRPQPGMAPTELHDLLDRLALRRGLRVHVLAWDFSRLFALEHELGRTLRTGLRTHGRVRFRRDSKHPFGASAHQKIVVVDDTLAFVGGLDLIQRRLDTITHGPHAPRHPDGGEYGPIHDVQALVSGPAAAALGELARERWRRVAGKTPAPRTRPDDELWPRALEPDLCDVPVALARTQPEFGGLPAVREVERLFLASIAAARHTIYVENQYLSAPAIVDALARRLEQRHGPEIVLVLPRRCPGWLEQRTMGVLSQRALWKLRNADHASRLRALHPLASCRSDTDVHVHSKVMCIDDELLRIGSANMTSRSMGLDSECDVVALAENAEHRGGIARVRDRLIGEHLDVPEERFTNVRSSAGLGSAIERLSGNDRTLVAFTIPGEPPPAPILPGDLDEPIEPTRCIDEFLEELRGGRRQGGPVLAWTLLVAMVLATAWVWSGPPFVVALHPLAAVGLFALASSLFVPASLLILGSVLVFGAVLGSVYAFLGALASALLTFALGRRLGPAVVQRLGGARLDQMTRKLVRRGALAVLVVRVLPIAPAARVGLACGAARLGLRAYAAGTALALLPGIAACALFGARLTELVRSPGPGNLIIVLAVMVLLVWIADRLDRHVFDHDLRGDAPAS